MANPSICQDQNNKCHSLQLTNTANSESFQVLLDRLIKSYISILPRFSKNKKQNIQSLRSKLYLLVFSHAENQPSELTLEEQLCWHSYCLFKEGKFREAQKLDECLSYLHGNGVVADDEGVRRSLLFLLSLYNVAPDSLIKQPNIPSPWVIPSKKDDVKLPAAPLSFSDARVHFGTRWFYTHYPSYLLSDESLLLAIRQPDTLNKYPQNACHENPGTAVNFKFLEEKCRNESCFGALIQSKYTRRNLLSSEARLQIPNLSEAEDYSLVSLVLEKFQNQKSSTNNGTAIVDEGYVSSQEESVTGKRCFAKDNTDIWDHLVSLGASSSCHRHSWESLHSSFSQEKPFLCDAESGVTRRLWSIERHHINTIGSSSGTPACSEVSSTHLCFDVLQLLVGIPSTTFTLNENDEFEARNGIYFTGMTPESLEIPLKELIKYGNKVKKLEKFSRPPPRSAVGSDPPPFTSLKRAVQSFLRSYRQRILSLIGETHFMKLKLRSESLKEKIDFVHRICETGIEKDVFSDDFSLLGHLSAELQRTNRPSFRYLLLFLIEFAWQPILRFLEKWMYEGELWSSGSEFIIRVDSEALKSRSKMFWSRGFALRQESLHLLPEALRSVVESAFLCGKAMNLLKICCPQNQLVKNGQQHPCLRLCFSIDEMNAQKMHAHKYAQERNASYYSFKRTLDKMKENEVKKREKLVQISTLKHLKFIKEFEEKRKHERWESEEKKKEAMEIAKVFLKQKEVFEAEMKEEEEEEERERQKLNQNIWKEENLQRNIKRSSLISFYGKRLAILDEMEATTRNELNCLASTIGLEFNACLREGDANECQLNGPCEGQRLPLEPDNESVLQMSLTSDLQTPSDSGQPDVALEDPFIRPLDDIHSEAEIPYQYNRIDNSYDSKLEENANAEGETPTEPSFIDKLNRNYTSVGVQSGRDPNRNERTEGGFSEFVSGRKIKTLNRLSGKSNASSERTEFDRNANLQTYKRTEPIQGEERCSTNMQEPGGSALLPSLVPRPTLQESSEVSLPSLASSAKLRESSLEPKSTLFPSAMLREPVAPLAASAKILESSEEATASRVALVMNSGEKEVRSVGAKPHGIRKSKSESSSIRDIGRKRNAVPQRASLFDFSAIAENDTPLLIDHFGLEADAPPTVSPKEAFREGELLACVTAPPPPPQDYSVDLEKPKERVTEVLSTVLHKLQATNDYVFLESFLEQRVPPSKKQLAFSAHFLDKGISEHLRIQYQLVNDALLRDFVLERDLLGHMEAIKRFVLLHDAPFASSLTRNILQKNGLDPFELNEMLCEAVRGSSFPNSQYAAANVTCAIFLHTREVNVNRLDYMELQYKVTWPLSIILDEIVLEDYSRLSKFLIFFHQVMRSIEDTFAVMSGQRKCDAPSGGLQFHQASIFRHEIHNVLMILAEYIAHQAIEGSWCEMEKDLRERVHALDDLYDAHWRYVQQIKEKCFLTAATSQIQTLIEELLGAAVQFGRALGSYPWRINSATGRVETPSFPAIKTRYERFREVVLVLRRTLEKLFERTQLSYVESLISQLNFNNDFLP